jgi:cell division transport system permease protein
MIYRNLRFALNSAWQSFWRNLAVSTAAVLSITLILILAGVNLLVGHAFSQVLDGFRAKVSQISVNVADGTPLQTVYDFQHQLAADPRVTSVQFVTKDEALAQFKADPNNVVLAQQIEGNPLDAKLEVRVAKLDDVAAIDTLARRWSGVDPTDPTNYQGDFVNRMLQLSAWLGLAGVGLLAILVVVSIVIVMNTIRTAVYHRRKEIEVMKLVGATDWFVRWPFIVEGLIVGMVGAVVAVLIVGFGYRPAVVNLQSVLIFVPLAFDPYYLRLVLAAMLGFGLLLGSMGSYLGVRRFLKQ